MPYSRPIFAPIHAHRASDDIRPRNEVGSLDALQFQKITLIVTVSIDLAEDRRAGRAQPQVARLRERLPELEDVDVEELPDEVRDDRRDEELRAAAEDLRELDLREVGATRRPA